MNSAILLLKDIAAYPKVYTLPLAGLPFLRSAWVFSFRRKPKFTGHWHCTGGTFSHFIEFACGNDHFDGRRPNGGSNELPEAYAENFIGLGR
jgi:hypothetical protein